MRRAADQNVPRLRHLRWILPAAAAAVVAVVVAAIAFPSVAATSCPRCFGLSPVSPGIYTEAGATPEQTRAVTELADAARRQLREFYGDQLSSPTVLACLEGSADRCLVRPDGPLPVSLAEWLGKYDGSRQALTALVDGLRSGRTFADVVGH